MTERISKIVVICRVSRCTSFDRRALRVFFIFFFWFCFVFSLQPRFSLECMARLNAYFTQQLQRLEIGFDLTGARPKTWQHSPSTLLYLDDSVNPCWTTCIFHMVRIRLEAAVHVCGECACVWCRTCRAFHLKRGLQHCCKQAVCKVATLAEK